MNYMKAYKVNSQIISVIEKHGGINVSTKKDIQKVLISNGYRKDTTMKNCNKKYGTVLNAGIDDYEICLYLAKKLDLYPKDIYLQYHAESLLAMRDDITLLYRKVKKKECNDEEYKKYKDMIILYLQRIEDRYKELGSGKYYLGEELSVADFFLGCMIEEFSILVKEEDIMAKYAPGIKKLVERLKQNELKEFYEKYYFKVV